MQREQRIVHYALSQLGFIGASPMDWIYHRDGVTCAVPLESTTSFDVAVSFLRDGAFQHTLQKPTRLLYYRLAELLDGCRNTKGLHEQRNGKERRTTTA